MYAKWAFMAYAIKVAHANVDLGDQPTSTTYPPNASVPTITRVTSVASPTASLSAKLPSQVPLPPQQAWCPSKIFCPGAASHVFIFASCLTRIYPLGSANRQHRRPLVGPENFRRQTHGLRSAVCLGCVRAHKFYQCHRGLCA